MVDQGFEKVGTSLEMRRLRLLEEGGERMMKWFAFRHLPVSFQEVSTLFCSAAIQLCEVTSRGPERTVALRKLLEAKDAGLRALIEETE